MRVIRSSNQNVSPSDDAKLFRSAHTDGLFESVDITSLGSNQVSIPALYGIMQGRDFTSEAQTLLVALPTADTGTGYVIVRFNTATTDVISFVSQLAPYTPVYDDINTTGTICEMIIATYTATPVAITKISNSYALSSLNATLQMAFKTSVSIATANIASDSTYTSLPYRSTLQAWTGLTADYKPDVSINPDNAYEDNFMVASAAGGFYVYFASLPTEAVVFDYVSMQLGVNA